MTDTLPVSFDSQVLHAHTKLLKWRAAVYKKVQGRTESECSYQWSEPLVDPDAFRRWALDVRQYVLQHRVDAPQPVNSVPAINADRGMAAMIVTDAPCARSMSVYSPVCRDGRVSCSIPNSGDAIVKVSYPLARSITLQASISLECNYDYQLRKDLILPILTTHGESMVMPSPMVFPHLIQLSVDIDTHLRESTGNPPTFKVLAHVNVYNTGPRKLIMATIDAIPPTSPPVSN